MEKPSYKLVGAPCGQHGQYTFYKAIRLTGERERIVAIGDFFFVRIWQDSELVSIGELQLLWTDRVSDQTLVSLRLYFLPENTPDGRSQHGEDEVLAINDKVVVRAEDLLSWVCEGAGWRWGLRAVWRGACAPPADPRTTAPLHHTKLDFSDVEREKNAITVDADSAGVMVFSYPRYCRYRALLSRLEGIQADWLRDSLVAALGGYAAPTKNTRILYCKETFEYPELEGHEFVCNHLAPRLKGRPRGRRRRQRSRSVSRSDSEEPQPYDPPIRGPLPPPGEQTLRRLSLRNGAPKSPQSEEEPDERSEGESKEERDFLQELRQFYRARNESFKTLKHLSLRALYAGVASRGGYEAVCRARLWRALSPERPARARRHYERFLLPFENHERKNGSRLFHKIANGRLEEPKTIDTIEVHDSPLREVETSAELPDKRLRTPSPRAAAAGDARVRLDNETGEVIKADEPDVTSKPAEELNREFLDSLPKEEKPLKITLKPVEKLLDGQLMGKMGDADGGGTGPGFHLNELTQKLSLASADAALLHQLAAGERRALNGHFAPALAAHHAPQPSPADQRGSRPAGRSSLRAVRVKPTRPLAAAAATPPVPPPPLRPDSASCSPQPGSLNNFGIHHPPPAAPGAPSAQPSAAPAASAAHSDDEIVEVPYKPKTPEIIDLDEYPESPQSVKKKKLDILKERGLEVTAVPPAWAAPTTLGAPLPAPLAATLAGPLIGPPPIILSPAVQHQIMTQAQLLHMYNIIPPSVPNGVRPPKVIQATSIYGTTGPEKTVYGNPKDPFMPPPHVLRGAPVRWARGLGALPSAASPSASAPQLARDPLDLTCRPAVEIMRVPAAAPASQPATTATTTTSAANSYTLLDGKALVGSNLEITLVGPKHTPPKRPPQKRSSNGKFVSSKTPTPPRPQLAQPQPAKSPLVVPNYQLSQEVAPLVDPAYVSAFCGGLGRMDQRQLAAYRDLVANQFRGYSGLLNIGTPTTKN